MATLTIDVDEDVLQRARELAKARGETVEAAVNRLLKVLAMPPVQPDQLPPKTRAAYGLLRPQTDEEDAAALDEYRNKKYGNG